MYAGTPLGYLDNSCSFGKAFIDLIGSNQFTRDPLSSQFQQSIPTALFGLHHCDCFSRGLVVWTCTAMTVSEFGGVFKSLRLCTQNLKNDSILWCFSKILLKMPRFEILLGNSYRTWFIENPQTTSTWPGVHFAWRYCMGIELALAGCHAMMLVMNSTFCRWFNPIKQVQELAKWRLFPQDPVNSPAPPAPNSLFVDVAPLQHPSL